MVGKIGFPYVRGEQLPRAMQACLGGGVALGERAGLRACCLPQMQEGVLVPGVGYLWSHLSAASLPLETTLDRISSFRAG